MATVYREFVTEGARFLTSAFPQYVVRVGTNLPASYLGYDAATDEAAFWKFTATNYGSGNLTLDLYWNAASSTSGNVVWGAAVAAVTPDTDSGDLDSKAFATEDTVTDSHLGTNARRVHKCAITISNLDSIASGDVVWLRIRRVGSSGSDTMSGDGNLLLARLSYSDT